MLRSKGYCRKGERLYFRGAEFNRKPRESLLCFLGMNGLVDCFRTEGTYDRHTFADCLMELVLRNRGIHVYPGTHCVVILDGA